MRQLGGHRLSRAAQTCLRQVRAGSHHARRSLTWCPRCLRRRPGCHHRPRHRRLTRSHTRLWCLPATETPEAKDNNETSGMKINIRASPDLLPWLSKQKRPTLYSQNLEILQGLWFCGVELQERFENDPNELRSIYKGVNTFSGLQPLAFPPGKAAVTSSSRNHQQNPIQPYPYRTSCRITCMS